MKTNIFGSRIKVAFILVCIASTNIFSSCHHHPGDNPTPQKTYAEYIVQGNWKIQTLEFQDDAGAWHTKTIDAYYQSWAPFSHITFNTGGSIATTGYDGSPGTGSWSISTNSIAVNFKDQASSSIANGTIDKLDDATFQMEWTISATFKDPADGVSFHAKAARETLVHY